MKRGQRSRPVTVADLIAVVRDATGVDVTSQVTRGLAPQK